MRHLFFALFIVSLIACNKDDDPVAEYPKIYTFDRVDQTDEGLYLVSTTKTIADLPTNVGLYGAYKDSLKTEIQNELEAELDLQEIELVSATEIRFHYIYQGHPIVTPTSYTIVDGEIIIPDTLFNGLVSHDKSSNQFILCGVTPFALPGPNAFFPFGPPYFQFNTMECIDGHTNREYAMDFLNKKDLQPMDTIGVLVTKYVYTK